MNIAQLLARNARAFPDRVAVACGTTPVLTFRTLAQRAARMASWFRATLRLDAADRIAVCVPNTPEFLEIMAGIWWAGLTAVPVDPLAGSAALADVVRHAGASLCFLDGAQGESSSASLDPDRMISIRSDRYRQIVARDAEISIHWNVPDDVAWLWYNPAHATHRPGVMLSHRNLLMATLSYFSDVAPVSPDDGLMAVTPLAHDAGLYALPHLAVAGTVVLPEGDGFDADEVSRLTARGHGTTLFVTPAMVRDWLSGPHATAWEQPNSPTLICGAGELALPDLEAASSARGLRFVRAWGRPEGTMAMTTLTSAHVAGAPQATRIMGPTCVGMARSPVELRVLGPDEQPAPSGEPGEIVVRGDTVMRGYWRDPRATATAMRGGWLHTGVKGSLDEFGFLAVHPG